MVVIRHYRWKVSRTNTNSKVPLIYRDQVTNSNHFIILINISTMNSIPSTTKYSDLLDFNFSDFRFLLVT